MRPDPTVKRHQRLLAVLLLVALCGLAWYVLGIAVDSVPARPVL
jgi:hypothetical protein